MSITRGFAYIFVLPICLAVLLSCVNISQAAVIWSPDSGIGDGFTWSNGQSGKGFFGNPIFTDNTFTFAPPNFRAYSSNGSSGLIKDSLQFDIAAEKGIESIKFAENGSYSITEIGSVKAVMAITIVNLDVYQKINQTCEATLDAVNQEWSGYFEVSIPGWKNIRITLSDTLTARSTGTGSSSWIKKEAIGVDSGVGIEIVTVPEPATVAILTMGGLAISVFGRKKQQTHKNI